MRDGEYVILNRVCARAMSLLKDHVGLEPLLPRLGTFARKNTRETPFDRCMKRRSYVYNAARLSSTDALFASYVARLDVEQKRIRTCESMLDLIGSDERYAAGGEREEQDSVESLISIIESDRKTDKLKWKPLPMRPKSRLIQAIEADRVGL
ncbi:hypothetical protein DOTSEDRAFT_23604 [Dothistroma septosporum NZE10]|uniref:Uncharacterized protein n=1 Tax=Dothistroma septosporum (strain NZE10 / CBS 128990) TaxID=675120 RepID=N1PQC4_DOTSN|nr:hypothetical protein DOTSEDRAFT_23604 [Dothistroma septosporum NZE10]